MVRRTHHDTLLRHIHEQAGLQFPDERRPDMERAAQRAMVKVGSASMDDYLAELVDGRAPLSDLIEEIAVGETYFFREPAQFEFLRHVVLPEIARRKPSAPIRLWSAACSTGEEAYSLAILVDELGLAKRAEIVATDISSRALAHARLGEYRSWSLRGSGAERARPYLSNENETWKVDAKITSAVRFEQLNLTDATFPSLRVQDFDLILCRNVLIYFDRPTIARVASRLYGSLAEGGWLVLASSDPSLAEFAPFYLVATDGGVFYRKVTKPAIKASPAPEASRPIATTNTTSSAAIPIAPQSAIPIASQRATATAPATSAPPQTTDPSTAFRALANGGALSSAAEAARKVIKDNPLNAGNAYLYAAILVELLRDEEAVVALRRAVYLDASFIAAHLALGMALGRLHDPHCARLSFQTVVRLCAAVDQGIALPFTDGAYPGHIAAVADAQVRLLQNVRSSDRG